MNAFFYSTMNLIHFSFLLDSQSLDEVNITIETCEFGRTEASGAAGAAGGGWQTLTAPQGKYSFVNKIIDGITVTVNTVNINFKSPAFTASVQVSIYCEHNFFPLSFAPLTHIQFSTSFSNYSLFFTRTDVTYTCRIEDTEMAKW